MEKQITFENSNGIKLAGILNETGNHENILIMVHGFNSNKNSKNLVRLSEMLDKAEISSFRFDIYGHGKSGGNFEDITISETVGDILQAIKFVKEQGYKNIGLLGSSFGGIASIMAASKSKDVSFLSLKSPVSDYLKLEKSRFTEKEFGDWKRTGYRNYKDDGKTVKLKYTFIEDFKNNNAYRAAKLINIPVLIVHGSADKDVPLSQSKKLMNFLPNGKLITIEGADHRYTNETHATKMLKIFYDFGVNNFSHGR
ncbi:MAG: alpha/beta fold hydrolase [Candidatus Microgenomates bacterium]